MPAGVPSGYDSKGDFFKGITSQMRLNQKSNSPGYPGSVAAVVTKNYSNLIAAEVKKVGFSGTNASDAAAANATKEAEKSRIKAMDAAHYSLTGQAAREQQDLSWYQRLDMSTVGGNTRHDKGGIDSSGDYVDQEFMSFETKDNWIPGKTYTTNLRSKKDIELFGDSLDALNEINFGEGSQSLMQLKDQERLVEAIIDGVDFTETDSVNHKIDQIKKEVAFEQTLGEVVDQRNIFQKAGDAIDDFTKPVADYITKKVVELNKTTVLGELTGHLVDSYNAADQSLDRLVDNISDIGKGTVEFGTQYVDAIQSIYTAVDGVDDNFVLPSELADMRHQKVANELAAERAALVAADNIDKGYNQYYGARVKGAEIQAERIRKEAEAHALEILSNEKAHTHRQDVLNEWNTEQEIEAFEAQLKTDLAVDKSKKIAESKRQRIADVKERTAALQREKEDKRQNDRIDDIANKSDEAARQVKAEKQRKEHDQFQNDRIDKIANDSDSAAAAAEARNKQMAANAANLATQKHLQQVNSTTADDIAGPSSIRSPYKTLGKGDGTLHGTDPFRFTTLEYPKNITSDIQYGHYILFYVNVQNKTKYAYHGYNDDGNYAVIGDVVEHQEKIPETEGPRNQYETGRYRTKYTYSKGANEGLIDYQKQQAISGRPGNVLQSNQVTLMRQRKATQGLSSKLNLTSRITDSVAMYLPSSIGNTTATGYTGDELGMAGYLALGGADLLGQLQNRDFAAMGETAVTMGGRLITEGMKKAAIGTIDAFTGASTEGAINKVFGQTLNPFIEVTFNNMGVRSFEYTFNFRPKNEDETKDVKAIIQLFRFHMVPELKGSNHRYMTLPSTFDIHYMYQSSPSVSKENDYYNKIATCVLKNCDVNYAPEGVKSFGDGAPTQITMTLSFMETEMLTKQKVDDGF